MKASPRAQYLYGKSVVDLGERSIWRVRPLALQAKLDGKHPAGAAVDSDTDASHGDLRQAEYYQKMLEDLAAAVNAELTHHQALFALHETNGDSAGVMRSQRIIRVKETELGAICQLTDALSTRFGASRIGSRIQDCRPVLHAVDEDPAQAARPNEQQRVRIAMDRPGFHAP